MPLPSEAEIRNPLLMELAQAGGELASRDVYERLQPHFPGMSEEDIQSALASGHNRFKNRVRWTRQRLVAEGLLDPSVRGQWKLTEEGRRVVGALRD